MALWLVKGLLIEYLIILVWACIEKEAGLALYFFGSAILTVGIIMMRQT